LLPTKKPEHNCPGFFVPATIFASAPEEYTAAQVLFDKKNHIVLESADLFAL